MRRLILLTFLSALCVQAAAADMTPKPANTAKAPKEKKICRIEEVTGSIMMHSICNTKEDWARIDASNARGVQHVFGRDGVPAGNAATRQ